MAQNSKMKMVVCTAVFSLATFGCGVDAGPTATEQQIIDEAESLFDKGKAFLEAGDYEEARAAFRTIVSETEDEKDTEYVGTLSKWDKGELISKSRFCFVLADIFFQMNNAVDQLADIFDIATQAGILGSPSVVLTPSGKAAYYAQMVEEYGPKGAGGTDSLIDNLLDDIRAPFALWVDELVKVRDGSEFSIEFNDLPVKIGDTTVMKIPGEYDRGEVFFILSLASFVAGSLDGIIALNMAIDLGSAVKDVVGYVRYEQDKAGSTFLDFNKGTFAKDILDLVAIVMYLNPGFLTVGDVDRVSTGADETADAFKFLSNMFDEVKRDAESGDAQDNDVIAYYKNAEEDIEYIELHFDLVLVVPIDGVDASKLENLQVELNDDFLNALDNVETAFRGGGSARVEWARDIVPMISLAAVTILRTGVFDALIADAAGDEVNELLGSGFLTPEVIGGVLTSVIPDVFRFNVGAIRDDGGCGIRCILPLWTLPQEGYDKASIIRQIDGADSDIVFHPFSQISFVYEYECFDRVTKERLDPLADLSFICNDEDAVDSRHFEDITGQTFSYSLDGTVFTTAEPDTRELPASAIVTFETELAFDRALESASDEAGKYSDQFPDDGVFPGAVKENPAFSAEGDYNETTTATWGINGDGIASRLPYIAFQDGSLGGLIEYNFSAANLSGDELKALDDLNSVDVWTDDKTPKGRLSRALNGLISKIAANIVSFIPSGD